MPIGDPPIPRDFHRAKEVLYRMTERADIGDGAEAEVITNEIFSTEETEPQDTGTVASTPQKESCATVIDPLARSSTSRPIFRRRSTQQAAEASSFNEVLKMMMLQDQQRRDDGAKWREKDRRDAC